MKKVYWCFCDTELCNKRELKSSEIIDGAEPRHRKENGRNQNNRGENIESKTFPGGGNFHNGNSQKVRDNIERTSNVRNGVIPVGDLSMVRTVAVFIATTKVPLGGEPNFHEELKGRVDRNPVRQNRHGNGEYIGRDINRLVGPSYFTPNPAGSEDISSPYNDGQIGLLARNIPLYHTDHNRHHSEASQTGRGKLIPRGDVASLVGGREAAKGMERYKGEENGTYGNGKDEKPSESDGNVHGVTPVRSAELSIMLSDENISNKHDIENPENTRNGNTEDTTFMTDSAQPVYFSNQGQGQIQNQGNVKDDDKRQAKMEEALWGSDRATTESLIGNVDERIFPFLNPEMIPILQELIQGEGSQTEEKSGSNNNGEHSAERTSENNVARKENTFPNPDVLLPSRIPSGNQNGVINSDPGSLTTTTSQNPFIDMLMRSNNPNLYEKNRQTPESLARRIFDPSTQSVPYSLEDQQHALEGQSVVPQGHVHDGQGQIVGAQGQRNMNQGHITRVTPATGQDQTNRFTVPGQFPPTRPDAESNLGQGQTNRFTVPGQFPPTRPHESNLGQGQTNKFTVPGQFPPTRPNKESNPGQAGTGQSHTTTGRDITGGRFSLRDILTSSPTNIGARSTNPLIGTGENGGIVGPTTIPGTTPSSQKPHMKEYGKFYEMYYLYL